MAVLLRGLSPARTAASTVHTAASHADPVKIYTKQAHEAIQLSTTTGPDHHGPPPLSTMFSSESLTDPDDLFIPASWLSPLLGPLSHTTCLCLKDILAIGGKEEGVSCIGHTTTCLPLPLHVDTLTLYIIIVSVKLFQAPKYRDKLPCCSS